MDPVWQVLGGVPISNGVADYTSIEIGKGGTPYVVFKDINRSSKATMMKYSGSSWETVGNPGFTPGEINSYLSFTLDSLDTPYIAYKDVVYSSGAGVAMKFNGTSWEYWGRFSIQRANNIKIAIGNDNKAYVAFDDQNYGPYWTSVRVNSDYKNWQSVGYDGWASMTRAYTSSLVFDSRGILYVGFVVGTTNYNARVRRYKNGNWENVGAANISAGQASSISLAVDSNDTLYIAYADSVDGYKATVKRYDENSNSWSVVGSQGFTTGGASYTSLAINGSDSLYLSFSDAANSSKATVMKYNESNDSWNYVGLPGFSVSDVIYPDIAIDKKGIPYVVFRDNASGGKAMVMYSPSETCLRTDQVTGECIPGTPEPDPGPYPDEPFDGNYGQGDATEEGNRTLEPEVPQPYPPVPCGGTHEQGSDECI